MSKFLKLVLLGLFVATPVFANQGPDFSIFEVRRELALSNEEKIEKDYYIYAGSDEGVKVGAVYDVVRKVPLYDGFQNRSLGEITIKVAQLKVIYASKGVSVARHYKNFSRASIPVLRDNYILLGDIVDISSESKASVEREPQSLEPELVDESVKFVINSVDVTDHIR